MPCYDADPRDPTISQSRLDILQGTEATLCAISAVLERSDQLKAVLDQVDWKEAGVKRYQFESWWATHKAEDELRRTAEQAAAERKRKISAARAKLTPEERQLLGLK
jgi:hypothetical protein